MSRNMPQNPLLNSVKKALLNFNNDTQNSWSFGSSYDSVGTEFETFVNDYMFPVLNEIDLIEHVHGNAFNFLAKEVDSIGMLSEEVVIMDTVPIEMDLSQDRALMLKENYPKLATKIYGPGVLKKVKFTLNNNDNRLNWRTLADGVNYAMAVYSKKISDINISEEREIKAMLVDYMINVAKEKRTVTSKEELLDSITKAVLNIQKPSEKYNEANLASGGSIGRYTTSTPLKDILIITNDDMQTYLLNSFIANSFNIKGIDFSSQVLSFDTLGGVFKTTKDIKLTDEQLKTLQAFGDYQSVKDRVIKKGTVFTYDVSKIFGGSVEEVKPKSELFAIVIDQRSIRYNRFTKGMLKEPFYNGEFDESNHWIHYRSQKNVSPFYSKIVITEA